MRHPGLYAVAIVFLAGSYASGDSTLTTLVSKGPSSNRVDIVFMGDGYTQADVDDGKYDTHITNTTNHIFEDHWRSAPLFRYRNFFNIHSIETISQDSGPAASLQDINDGTHNTPIGSYFFTSRHLGINRNKASDILTTLDGTGIDAEMRFISVNSEADAGSGGIYAVYAGGYTNGPEIALHEIAHAFSDLGDEYDGYPAWGGLEPDRANLTKDSTGAKWSHWNGYVDSDLPDHIKAMVGPIGAYEGGGGYDTGLYRPSDSSKMRQLFLPFNAVSREKIILDIYALVDPFDSWTDNSLSLIDPGELNVNCVDDDVINVEWFVDDELISTDSGGAFDLTDFGYGQGDYIIKARGYDPTGFDPIDGWVRMNQGELEQYVSWDVSVTPEPCTLLLLTLGGLVITRPRRTRSRKA